jgi:hypothetical protein
MPGGPTRPRLISHGTTGSDPVSSFIHWVLHGRSGTTGGGLVDAGTQFVQSLNPTHPANLLNLASLLVPGGAKGDMFPWTEDYSLPKAVGSGQIVFKEGRPYGVHQDMATAQTAQHLLTEPGYGLTPAQRVNASTAKLQALQAIHDALFGGTVHAAPGFSIPPRP